ncbi:MAG: alkaline phosphatase D family protein [Verrucomicrobiales bacterium]
MRRHSIQSIAGLASLFSIGLCTAQTVPLPAPATNPLISKIALGSCAHQEQPQPILHTIVADQPDLFIYLGDNIYGDTKDMGQLEAHYANLAARPEFTALRSAVPLVATWDDHDYGWNDAGKEYPFKDESKQIFLKFWQEPAGTERRSRPGIYTHYNFSDEASGRRLQIILLDTRSFRDSLTRGRLSSWKNDYIPNPDPSKTFLGEDQWRWLKERLEEPADIRIIGSSIQFAHQHNGWESWTNLPAELYRMVGLIKETQAEGVVFISGDVHWGELSVLKTRGGYPLHDLTASGLNRTWDTVEPNQNRQGDVYRKHHYGCIEIDWEQADPTITFKIKDVDGATQMEKMIALSKLTFPKPDPPKEPSPAPPEGS